jgi:two-component system response regulator NreC
LNVQEILAAGIGVQAEAEVWANSKHRMNVKVLLVDDHPVLRNGLRQAMAQRPDLTVVGEASTGASALEQAAKLTPDLIVLDVHLSDMNGIETARKILGVLPSAKILIFSGDVARPLVDSALQAGAHGYVCKRNAVEDVMQAIDVVMAGKLFFSPEVSAGILEDYRKGLIEAHEQSKPLLSEREVQLLRLIAEGRRNKEIAVQLGISSKSVETYRSRLTKKLGYSSPAELVRYAIREGIAVP